MALENSLLKVVSRGVHQGLDMGEGWERGAKVLIVAVRTKRDVSNH